MKRMESGSLLAICAMCFSISFLVMIPSSRLMTQRQREKREKSRADYFISYFVCLVMESQRSDKRQRRTHTHWAEVWPLVSMLWLQFITRSKQSA